MNIEAPREHLDRRQILTALRAFRRGDFSIRLNHDYDGMDAEIAETFNEIVELNDQLTREFERLSRVVGKDGRIGERGHVRNATGSWESSVRSVNDLIEDMVQPTAEVARVIGAVAKGNLSQTMNVEIDGRPLRGEFLRIGKVVNTMVEQLASFASEVTRVAREVGTEGKLGGQAKVKGVAGTWKDLTDNVNAMATNLTGQVRNIAEVTTAVASGDLSKKITVDVKGEILELKSTINTMVDQLNSFAGEVTRVAREVGTEGKLGGQADVKGVGGTWKDLTDNVNSMAQNLTGQVRNIAEVTTAVASGDLSKKITVDVKGEILELKSTINTMVDQLNSFAGEVTRVAREVGTEGKLGGQAQVRGVAGTWKDLTDNVNLMADNLTGQVRNIAEVTTAVASGDLSKKITVVVKGEIAELKDTINTMVDQLNSFASEVTRVAREVGTEGKLGGQAHVEGVGGTWKDLTDNVNSMAENLTGQVRNIAEVTTAVARGDLSKKITVDVKGEILELKDTINTMVDQLNSFAGEVTRVAREVGTEGKLGGQARVEGVGGTWKDLTDNVNSMAENLTGQVRNIAEVTTAVARGDLSKKITVDVKGEILELKSTINTMVDQLNSFAGEVTRVAREVGTEGKLGGQARVEGVGGTWKDLTDNVNAMAANLTGQVRNIAEVTTAVALGDLSKKITVDVRGEILELKSTINTMVDQLNSFAGEVTRVAREVGTEGKLGGQAQVRGVAGTWKDLTDNVNSMAENLTGQVRNIAEVTTAVARGDLSKKITVDVKGEILELKSTINTMVDQLNSFAGEVTRVAREVGTEGKLGGQARVEGVAGTWKDLTENVNLMATNLTNQVRGIADVVTAVAQGNLKRKLTVDAKGEIAALADTINGMIETLATFADQVTNMAREVGIEGKLGGQARVPGAAGLWRDLTDNVNAMAANLTGQVRSIADVATAVTKGDLSRAIAVEASGEMAALKDNINEMIRNLKDQTLKNAEQDWLKTNLARFSRMLQGERDLTTVSTLIMSELAPLVNAQYGVFYVTNRDDEDTYLELAASYGAESSSNLKHKVALREGLIGQSAADKRPILLDNVPPDYLRVSSGLGDAGPANVIILPALFEDDVKAVIELASFGEFRDTHQSFLDQLMESVGIVLNTIAATMRTEGLLKQSQLLTAELQARQSELTKKQEELHATNEELQEKAQLLENEKKQVENKNLEIEMARRALEEKAEQLALTSKYKSEFLANMSHELRTPLNSLLILSKLLASNQQGNLNDKQVDFARTINSAGTDLLSLINDILDLSKIESGTVSIDVGEMPLSHLRQHMERTFRQLAADKGLSFTINVDEELPAAIRTDEKRLQQIVLNLLSNAFKFTSEGGVKLDFSVTGSRGNGSKPSKRQLAISVSDTGIGIPEDKQKLIFEAFQQADGTTSRKFGGTGLGLSISREIARLLGGELQVKSQPGKGSTFTLVIPLEGPAAAISLPAIFPAPAREASLPIESERAEMVDDRNSILPEDRVVLIVEDDQTFGEILLEIARSAGLKGVLSTTGSGTLALARKLMPDAITLDLGLSDIDGWVLFDLLRHDRKTRRVPIHVISGADDIQSLLKKGAAGVSTKPVAGEELSKVFKDIHRRTVRVQRRVLVADTDSDQRIALVNAIRDGVTSVTAVGRIAANAEDLGLSQYDAIVLGLGRSAKENAQVMSEIEPHFSADLPKLLIFASHGDAVEAALAQYPSLKEVPKAENFAQLSNLVTFALPSEDADGADAAYADEPDTADLVGAKVLIVDDDIRNIYSLTSVLETYEIQVLHAERGRDGIEILQETPDVDVALIDIMMPEMDGYETMREIRKIPELEHLPLISVTAKAMKGDRQKCLEAGASDYIAKPVDIDLLLALLRVWVARSGSRHRADSAGEFRLVGRLSAPQMQKRPEAARTVNSSAAAKMAQRPVVERSRILVVDDDDRNLLAISVVLEPVADVLCARSGEEALRFILKEEFAVILLDVFMPGLDGYETATLIRQREHSKRTPIIFLTAMNKEDSHMLRGYDTGAVDYVFKPFEPVILKSKVAVFVDLFEKAREIQQKAVIEQKLLEENLRAKSEMLLIEQKLRQAEERQEAILRSLPVCFHSREATPPFGAQFVSDAVERLTGFPPERLTSEPEFGLSRVHPDDLPHLSEALRGAAETGSYSVEFRWRCADGAYRIFLDQGVISRDAEGKPVEIFGTLLDITERRQLEDQLMHSQRLDAIGKLTGGVAHDFNNLLAAILGGLSLIERRIEPTEEVAKVIGMTRHAATQGAELINRMLAFSRRQQLRPNVVRLPALMETMNSLVTPVLGGLVRCDWRMPDDLWPAYVDSGQLELALMNLILNARDAMPSGGTITIRGENHTLAEGSEGLPRGEYVVVAVDDTGSGITPQNVSRVIEPFFTTKDVGKGTGLGLSTAYGFAKQSGGTLRIDSVVERGTTVELWLPRSTREETETPRQPESITEVDIAAGQAPVILLVDDSTNLREVTAGMLRDRKYEVVAAGGGAEALALIEREPERFDLIVTDFAMPIVSGIEVVRFARNLRAGWPAIIITGYADVTEIANRPDDVPLINKPFSDAALLDAIRTVMSASRTGKPRFAEAEAAKGKRAG